MLLLLYVGTPAFRSAFRGGLSAYYAAVLLLAKEFSTTYRSRNSPRKLIVIRDGNFGKRG